MSERVAIFPGCFDPFTKGHHDIVSRGLQLFDKIVIAMGYNSQKKRYFAPEQMCELIRSSFEREQSVEVIVYDQLTATLAQSKGVRFLLRGLRNTTDFEFENSVSQLNKSIYSELDVVFLITSATYSSISSSLIREVHEYGGDISPYLPYDLPSSFRRTP